MVSVMLNALVKAKGAGDGLLVRSVPAEAIRPGRIAGHGGSYLKTVRAGESAKLRQTPAWRFVARGEWTVQRVSDSSILSNV